MDTLRVVTFTNNRRPTVVLDVNNGSSYELVRDTFTPKPSNRSAQFAQSGRRYGGARLVNETHDNGTLEAEWYVSGSTSDDALTKMEALLRTFESIENDRWVEWRMEGALSSVFYQLRGPATWEPMYRWIETVQTHTLHVKGSWPIAPLGEGLPLDIYDAFAVDSLSDFTAAAGGGTLTWSSSGAVALTSTSNKLYVHTARGYKYDDAQVTFKFTTGASAAGTARSIGVYIDSNNYLFAENTSTTLRVGKRDVGAESTLGSTAAFALAANTTYWLRFRSEDNNVFAEIFTSEPSINAAPSQSTNVALSGADATKFGRGSSGQTAFYLTPAATDWRINGFTVEPYTYRARSLPEAQRLDAVPGTAPARMSVQVGSTLTSSLPGFLMGWLPSPKAYNLVANGDFEGSTQGWQATAVTGVIGAATSITRNTSAAKYGTANGQVVTPATTDTGASFPIYRRFKRGQPYTLTFWARSAANTTALRAKLGQSGDIATGTASALTTNFQQYSVTWTPTADRDVAYVVAGINAATATTFQIDGVMVYEGTTVPTAANQIEGRGAFPPFGIIDLANQPLAPSAFVTTNNAIYRSGTGLQASGFAFGQAFALLDPSLLTEDDFQPDEIVLEVWVRVMLDTTIVTPTMTVSAYPYEAATFGDIPPRYTHEWGQSGKALQRATGFSNLQTLVRAGTLTLPVDTDNPGRWMLDIDLQSGPGSIGNFGVDYALILPVRSRASTPSSKPQDNDYPDFFAPQSGDYTKQIDTDLSGRLRTGTKAFYPDVGIGGQLLEVPGGTDVDVVALLSAGALDPVPLDASAGPTVTAGVHYSVTPRYFLGRGS